MDDRSYLDDIKEIMIANTSDIWAGNHDVLYKSVVSNTIDFYQTIMTYIDLFVLDDRPNMTSINIYS